MKTFADQRRVTPAFRRHAPPAMVHQAGRVLRLQCKQIRRILDPPRPQFKLTIGAPNDAYEQDADRVADQVMRMPHPGARDVPLQRICTDCEEDLQRQPLEEDEEIQAKNVVGTAPVVTPETEAGITSLKGRGQPLSESTRRFFEPRFGKDFSDVRVHTDDRAVEAAQTVSARAFTVGHDVVFGRSEYSAGTDAGKRLLAHELTHVVQQTGRRRPRTPVVGPWGGGFGPASGMTGLVSHRATDGSPIRRKCDPDSAIDWYASSKSGKKIVWTAGLVAELHRVVGTLHRPLYEAALTEGAIGPAFVRLTCKAQQILGFSGRLVDGKIGPKTISAWRKWKSGLPRIPPTPLKPLCPTVPVTTPKTCAARHTAYCDAAACLSKNSWLGCACRVSDQVCDAANAFALDTSTIEGLALNVCIGIEGPPYVVPAIEKLREDKGKWLLSTNECIWGHWRAALDVIHDPSRPLPSSITPEWTKAVSTCRKQGLESTACCDAHIVAEQNAIDRCDPYDSKVFGKLPTDIPGFPGCSKAIRAIMDPPFTGDFAKVKDRVVFGKKLCCGGSK